MLMLVLHTGACFWMLFIQKRRYALTYHGTKVHTEIILIKFGPKRKRKKSENYHLRQVWLVKL